MSRGTAARRLALDALDRIETDGAYANLVTNTLLDRSDLEARDRRLVTDLVYGTTRMRRACDHLVDRHRRGDVTARVGAALRLGAYQLAFTDVPTHAAVDATVGATPRPARGLVNAVLRRVAADVEVGVDWPDLATELSYPDWLVDELVAALGRDMACDALRAMNRPATTHRRSDGYVQDLASQAVVTRVDARRGHRVLDLCAAPGGKATGLAGTGADVVAVDARQARARLIVDNSSRVGVTVPVVVGDGRRPPFAPRAFDRVLVDAPCSGLGVLRRRPDARWRVDAAAPQRLAVLQRELLRAASGMVASGGSLVYSVCTITVAENEGVISAVVPGDGFGPPSTRTLAPDAERDGMYIAAWTRAL